MRLGHLAQRVAPIQDRSQFPGLDPFPEKIEVCCRVRRHHEDRFLSADPRSPKHLEKQRKRTRRRQIDTLWTQRALTMRKRALGYRVKDDVVGLASLAISVSPRGVSGREG